MTPEQATELREAIQAALDLEWEGGLNSEITEEHSNAVKRVWELIERFTLTEVA